MFTYYRKFFITAASLKDPFDNYLVVMYTRVVEMALKNLDIDMG